MSFWIEQTFAGLSYGALLFLLASGLSLIFGVMQIINMTHGSYFLLGGYLGLTVLWLTGSWLLALPLSALVVALLGVFMQRYFLRPLGTEALPQVMVTIGFLFIIQQASLDIWGGDPMNVRVPSYLDWSAQIGGIFFPVYRIFMLVTAIVMAAALWLGLEKTRVGAMVRASVDDSEMARGLGINTVRLSMVVFGLGAFLAGLGGVIGGGFIGVFPGLDFQILPLAFAVVIIGGLGTLRGAALGSLIVGLIDSFGKALFPELSYFTLFAPMAIVLALKPSGLFGRA
ncbi:MAG: branched-chain amino acid ABC transporter permease [Nitrospinota bacterium]